MVTREVYLHQNRRDYVALFPDGWFAWPAERGGWERRERVTEAEAEASRRLAVRLAKADWELSQAEAFDHVVVNDRAERAADEVAAIIDASPQVNGTGQENTGRTPT